MKVDKAHIVECLYGLQRLRNGMPLCLNALSMDSEQKEELDRAIAHLQDALAEEPRTK